MRKMSSSGFATGCGVGFGVLRFQRKNTAIPANATATPTPPYKVVFEVALVGSSAPVGALDSPLEFT